ncbi:MAG: M28 family peptidase [Planctomycetota bacterium]
MRDSHLLHARWRSWCVAHVALLSLVAPAAAPPVPPLSCTPPPPTAAHVDEPAALRTDLATLGPDAALWFEHVQTLTNPLFEGRTPGSRGGELTEEYVEFFFREYGLAPAFADGAGGGTGYRQQFRVEGAPLDGYSTAGALTIAGRSLAPGEDFVVTANSPIDEVTAPVTFVGYGIESGPVGFDSFGDAADLTGRIALLLRLEPLDEDGSPRWGDAPGTHSSLVKKFLATATRGAAGILLVNPPGAAVPLEGLDPLPRHTGFGCGALMRLPTAMITTEVAERLVRAAGLEGQDLMALRRLADAGAAGAIDFDEEVRVTLRTEVGRESLDTANVAAVLPGRGDLADRWIVIGAHHDHVGRGLGGVHPGNRDKLHVGADDNASGVAAVLLLARRLAAHYADAPEHADLQSILFSTPTCNRSSSSGLRARRPA